ncbi:Pkinase-domain-containing protein [Metschnikowia bicuspidata var. bicuspidata NRRL YB-4993]|uniref:Pkinase-domain-containing protein n=1 Tax=Metschnikowia bicuspidata var. bicuspidata NRRL YB-4993 TaxID=869754 RepID=A0A1A0H6E0_9ASCO|nr:Pkinase-domain-containing protein [Metschnikowia bicuspidata var. bicuspidata NRRL YB-4993]OBA19472.1 Pkinase-domain-containing protein [Metschnikowia bicuspidata var. bicuspidata NRRL YB-4993]
MDTQEYVLDEVVDNETSQSLPMFVKEYKEIGKGAFGTVVEALLAHLDENGQPRPARLGPFAIKRVLAQTEYKCRELEILRAVNHPNVVCLKYFFDKRSRTDGKMYQNLVMECLPLNLQSEIKYYRHLKYTIPYPHMKAYTFQLARAMLYLHGMNISHRDIKPSNILIDPSTVRLKICDFGSAKQLEPNQPSVSYICSRFYRAPELIVGCTVYTTKIDIWGLGCVIAEMFLGKPIFQGVSSELQLKEVSKLLGPPPKTFFFNSNPQYRGNMFSTKLFTGTIQERFERIFSNSPPDVIDLLLKVLVYDPEARASAKSIMLHPFFDELKQESFKVYPRGAAEPIKLKLYDLSEYELNLMGPLRDEFLRPLQRTNEEF